MPETTYLRWPFFDNSHRALATRLREWTAANAALFAHPAHDAVDAHCRKLVAELSAAGFTNYVVPKAQGGATEKLRPRSSMSDRSAWSANISLITPGSPTSLSPCRVSAPAQSRSSALMRFAPRISAASLKAR
jgi:alkylation response protein AidB-like acyl-CoA dehydrogenase